VFREATFVSRPQAEATPGTPNGVVVSLFDPGSPGPALQSGWRDVLSLAFFDADEDLVPFAREQGMVVCEPEHAQQILAFLDWWHAAEEGPSAVVVHCEQGISRSAAVAKFCARRYGLDFRWDYPFHNRRVLRLLHEAADMPFDPDADGRLLHGDPR
jgi:hypothetical protein